MFRRQNADAPRSLVSFVLKLKKSIYPLFLIKASVQWYNVVAEVGGVTSLWLGVSVAGIIHFIWILFIEIPRSRHDSDIAAMSSAGTD